jgi:Mg2+ and Co2+ transporter CorA
MFRIVATRGADDQSAPEILADAPLERLPALLGEQGTRVWVDLTEPCGEVEVSITRDIFKFHPLAIEDCFESRVQPKIDEYEEYLYLITHGLHATSTAESAEVVELDAFVGPNYIVTHHTRSSRSVATVTEAVLKSGLPLRRGPMGVLHALLDRQVDGFEEQLDGVEERTPSSRTRSSRALPRATSPRCWRSSAISSSCGAGCPSSARWCCASAGRSSSW